MKKVLIVDDNIENQYMLEVLLSSSGFQMISSSNGAEALEKARLETPDIVISDILMPVMDGYTLCKNWKADDRFRDIPFVFYTATYTDPKDEEFAISLGADRFIMKPMEIGELVKIIVDVLNEDRSKKKSAPAGQTSDDIYYKQYNETLIRKLEQKMIQLEKTNITLKEEILERQKAEEFLKISLDEKVTLLRELYHRTRNNMQLISSLLSIKQTFTPGNELDAFVADMQNRIGSMSLVHKKLYEAKNLSSISLGEFIHELCDTLLFNNVVLRNSISFEYEVVETKVIIEIAVPFALILNELISNSFKHAFPEGGSGLIKISLHRAADNFLEFSYSDNGTGLPEGFDFYRDGKMGFTLITILVKEQLKGKIDLISGTGFNCLIRFNDFAIKYSS